MCFDLVSLCIGGGSGYNDFKKIFVEQVIEYMLMGKMITDRYGSSAYLLASDHRAMRPYYLFDSDINLVVPLRLISHAKVI